MKRLKLEVREELISQFGTKKIHIMKDDEEEEDFYKEINLILKNLAFEREARMKPVSGKEKSTQ